MDGDQQSWWVQLEALAEGLALAARDTDVAQLTPQEYSEVDFAGRLHASVGRTVMLTLRAHGKITGELERCADAWVAVQDGNDWLLNLDHVLSVSGLAAHSVPASARGALSRLAPGAVLRRLSQRETSVIAYLTDASSQRGLVGRVGADFLEIAPEDGGSTITVVPWASVVAVRSR